jgi:hypothetical protein
MTLGTPLRRRDRLRQFLSPNSSTRSSSQNIRASSATSTSQPNSSRTSTVTQQNFQDLVFLLLSQQDQDTIRQHTVPNSTDVDAVVQQALTATKQKGATCQSKRWTFTFCGHTVVLREKADNIIKWLDRFKQVGDIGSNADPVHVGLPWAGIRFLLEVSIIERMNNVTSVLRTVFILTALRQPFPSKVKWRLSSSASKQPSTYQTDFKCIWSIGPPCPLPRHVQISKPA